MSYDHQKLVGQINLVTHATGVIALGTAQLGARLIATATPLRLRGVYATVTVAFDTADTVLSIRKRPTPGSASGQTLIDTLTIPNGAVAGAVYYVDGLDARINPGEEIYIDSDGGTTAGVAAIGVMAESIWDVPGNYTNMHESA